MRDSRTKYMVMSGDRNAGQNDNIKLDNKFFERLEQFKYFGTALTNLNSIQDDIKSRLKSRNACYHSMQHLVSYSLLYKDTNIKIYRTVIVLLFCMGVRLGLSH
jgi:hypothetical protein